MSDHHHIPDRDEEFDGYAKIDRYKPDLIQSLSGHYHEVLKQIGEKPEREGLLKTPERVAKAMLYLTQGYDLNAKEILTSAMFKEEYSKMVFVLVFVVLLLCVCFLLLF